jgi:DNA/RNA-binding domain of Phe-tRNA-synthetase-like protein
MLPSSQTAHQKQLYLRLTFAERTEHFRQLKQKEKKQRFL